VLVTCPRKTGLALLLAVVAVGLLAVGCDSAAGRDGFDGGEGPVAGYAGVLAERYEQAFPDDRVLTVRIVMDSADWQAMQSDVVAKVFYRADVWIDDELVPDVAVRTKGSSSLMGAASSTKFRVGLKVDLNFFNAERSYHGVQKMVYNNGFSDPTLMREFLSYEVMALMGVPTPRACFADVWVNGSHLGVYTQVEAIDAGFLMASFDDYDGNLYKPEVQAGALDWTEADMIAEAARDAASPTTTTTERFNVGGGDLREIIDRLGADAGWIPGVVGAGRTTTTAAGLQTGGPMARIPALFDFDTGYLTSAGLRTNENYSDYSRLFELLEVLNSDLAQVSTDDLEDVLQVDEVLRFLATSVALVHLDNYIGMAHNYYLYEDRGRFWILPWDLNMTFGGFNSGVGDEQLLNFYIDEPTAAPVEEYPLVLQLLDEPEYRDAYHGYLRELIEGPFSVGRMTERINEIADLIRPYVEKDGTKFFSTEDFEAGLTQSRSATGGVMQSGGGKFIGLTYFVKERVASIAAQLSGFLPSGSGHGSGNGGGKGLAAFGMNRGGLGAPPGPLPGQEARPMPPGRDPTPGTAPPTTISGSR
jgi:spore coat protein CotH